MGRIKSAINSHLPKYVLARSKTPGRPFYYLSVPRIAGSRTEIPLGDDFDFAIKEAERIKTELGLEGKRRAKRPGDGTAKDLFIKVRKGAKARGFECEITLEHIQAMLDECEGRCSLTGIAFNENWDTAKRIRPFYPSIDRINPDLGYTKENCRVVAACVNIALNNFGDELLTIIAHGIIKTKRMRVRSAPQST